MRLSTRALQHWMFRQAAKDKQKMSVIAKQYFDYFLVMDFEATCERNIQGRASPIVKPYS
jgi:hypothetical protein